MSTLFVESRPFPGAPELVAPDLTVVAGSALASARRALVEPAILLDHPAGCRCSVWCRDEWEFSDHAIGDCVAGDGPCRSTDPEGRVRHPLCEVPA